MIERRVLPRFRHLVYVPLVIGLLAAWWLLPASVGAQDTPEVEVQYVESTGQYISNEYGFLDYWRADNRAAFLGAPVTGLLIENELVVQYFERGRLEAHVGVGGAPVMLGHVGAEYAAALWLDLDADSPPPATNNADIYVFPSTGRLLPEPFLSFWRNNEGLATLGYPISEVRWEYVGNQMLQVQYFERGRLEYHPQDSNPARQVSVSNLGYELAILRGYTDMYVSPSNAQEIDQTSLQVVTGDTPPTTLNAATSAESQSSTTDTTRTETPQTSDEAPDTQTEDTPQLQTTTSAPDRVTQATTPRQTFLSSSPSAEEADWEVAWAPNDNDPRYIVVSVSRQMLYAFENGEMVFNAPVSTGMDGFETPLGEFFIYARNPLQTMSGNLGGEYSVPNVPNSMYIIDDVAMHGTYWHNDFGTGNRRSHGCINLPLDSASWLYNWAAVGVPVIVTDNPVDE